MGRKKSKRPTKETARQNRSNASSNNSASADNAASGSTRSTSRTTATASVSENRNATRNAGPTAAAAASVRGDSSHASSRRTVSALATNSGDRVAQTACVTLQSVLQNVSIAPTPENRSVNNSSQTTTRNIVSISRTNQRSQVSQTPPLVTNTEDREDPILYPIFFTIRFADGMQIGEWICEMTTDIEVILGRQEIDLTILKDKSTLLIKAKSQSESNRISNITSLINRRVTVRPHSGLNSSQGTIYEKGILMNTNEEILNHLRSQHVTKVYRFRKKVNGIIVDTPRLLLTFDTPQPPKQIKVAFTWHQVRLFSPTPRRCFNCQSFQHPSKYCTSPPICPLCAEPGHTYPPRCNKPLKCTNCLEDHSATSPECPVFKAEKKIQLLHARAKIGIYKARQLINTQIVRDIIAASIE